MNTIKLTIEMADIEEYATAYFSEHPRARKKPIERPYHPSTNEWMIMKRMQMNVLKNKWRQFTVWLVQKKGLSGLHIHKCEIMFRVFFRTYNRHDNDNITPKFILDGFVDSGLIDDDDNKHVTMLSLCSETDPVHPRTEIEIKILE